MDGSRTKNEHGLTERQEAFCREYVLTGGKKELSAKAAGYTGSPRTRAWELINKDIIQGRIRDLTHKELASLGAESVKVLQKLMNTAKSETVRQGCATVLLDRAGYKHAEKLEVIDKRSIEEIDSELADLLQEAGKEAEEIIEETKH